MTEAFFHREQDIGVASRLDMDHAIRVKPGQLQGRGKQVVPAQAPEDRAIGAGEDAGKEDGCARVVRKFGAPNEFVKGAGCYSAQRQARVDRLKPERDDIMPRGHAFDSRNFGANIGKDGGLVHDVIGLGRRLIRSLFVPTRGKESSMAP